MKLYTYCVRWDNGAAPNPYWDICTLTICKPAIRKSASVGDWIVGLGSTNSPIGNISGHVVYAMQVTDIRSLWGYDIMCRASYPGKIPDLDSNDFRRRVGDCIYDYSKNSPPLMRDGVHDEGNRDLDLSGENALISSHFYYFGDTAVELPENLKSLTHNQPGHKVRANQPYIEQFCEWIENLGYEANRLNGNPQLMLEFDLDADIRSKCAGRDLDDDDDEIC